jgi:2-haloalkanoic acid dehalogenase type II
MLKDTKKVQHRLTDFKILSFDCYGTLIDWETGMYEALKPLAARAGHGLGREQVLEAHARHESAQQAETPGMIYSELLAQVHRHLAREWGVKADPSESAAYGHSIKNWPAFPDSAEALKYLKKHYKLVILSNVDRESFGFSRAKLQVEFDHVFTAQDIGSYKPDLRNFEYMLQELAKEGVQKYEILHTAQSLFHDHQPANRVGLTSAWIDRRAGKPGSGATMPTDHLPSYGFRFTSMAEMAQVHMDSLKAS